MRKYERAQLYVVAKLVIEGGFPKLMEEVKATEQLPSV